MRAGPSAWRAWMAARMLEPVASPSSTRITTLPAMSGTGRLPRYACSRRRSSRRFAFCRAPQVLLRDAQIPDDVVVEHDHAPTGNGTHGQLLMAGDAELANEEDVEWCAEGGGDLVPDRDAPPGERQHDHVVPAPVVLEEGGEGSPGLVPVPEQAVGRTGHLPAPIRSHPRPASRHQRGAASPNRVVFSDSCESRESVESDPSDSLDLKGGLACDEVGSWVLLLLFFSMLMAWPAHAQGGTAADCLISVPVHFSPGVTISPVSGTETTGGETGSIA